MILVAEQGQTKDALIKEAAESAADMGAPAVGVVIVPKVSARKSGHPQAERPLSRYRQLPPTPVASRTGAKDDLAGQNEPAQVVVAAAKPGSTNGERRPSVAEIAQAAWPSSVVIVQPEGSNGSAGTPAIAPPEGRTARSRAERETAHLTPGTRTSKASLGKVGDVRLCPLITVP